MLIINDRYESAATVVPSSLDFSEWGRRLRQQVTGWGDLGSAKLRDHRLVLNGDSYRAPRPLPESPKSGFTEEGKTN
jgi:hypothetical protein